jgi:hypothetical protein
MMSEFKGSAQGPSAPEPERGRVVHCMKEPYDVYVGRGRCPRTGELGSWGNPFTHRPSGVRGVTVVGSVVEAVALHRRWLWREIKDGRIGLAELAALHGATLGCWCEGLCHGQNLVAAAAWARAELGSQPSS